MTEKQFQSEVLKWAKHYGWAVYHTYDSRRSPAGFPDLVLVRDRVLFRELKTEPGKVSPAQKIWATQLVKAGADFEVWRPSQLSEIIECLQKRTPKTQSDATNATEHGIS